MYKILYVQEDTYNKRLETCSVCPHFTDKGLCDRCGCSMVTKAKLSNFNCPVGKF